MTVPVDTELRQQIVDSTGTLLPRVLKREVTGFSEQSRLMEDLGLTSSMTLELLLELEESLEIQINVEEIDRDAVSTVGNLADFIAGNLLTDE